MPTLINEGKTKQIWQSDIDPKLVVVVSKDDLTAGDGAKHDLLPGKGVVANQTTCNVFRLLNTCGIPTAFEKQLDEEKFLARKCEMIPYEVVIRREAHGSYLKRNPHLSKGHRFERLILEFYLKTSGKIWGEFGLPTDDPFVNFSGNQAQLFDPKKPLREQEPFLVLDDYPLSDDEYLLHEMELYAREVFLILEKAWALLGRKLVDLKLEFGLDLDGELILSDIVDNDSWRVLQDEQYLDKQFYREDGELSEVLRRYRQVEELTGKFEVPNQQIILWRGSTGDDIKPLMGYVIEYCGRNFPPIKEVTCSAHKEPIRAMEELRQIESAPADSVIVCLVGMSNGLGPTLAANTTIPVISVSATATEFPDDIHSSLRMPSNVPLATILSPKNAVLYGLQILALRNPAIFARLQYQLEERLTNFATI